MKLLLGVTFCKTVSVSEDDCVLVCFNFRYTTKLYLLELHRESSYSQMQKLNKKTLAVRKC